MAASAVVLGLITLASLTTLGLLDAAILDRLGGVIFI